MESRFTVVITKKELGFSGRIWPQSNIPHEIFRWTRQGICHRQEFTSIEILIIVYRLMNPKVILRWMFPIQRTNRF